MKTNISLNLILCDSVPVQHDKLQLRGCQSSISVGEIKDKRLIKHRIETSLLYVGFLLCYSLIVVDKIDLHIRVCGLVGLEQIKIMNSLIPDIPVMSILGRFLAFSTTTVTRLDDGW